MNDLISLLSRGIPELSSAASADGFCVHGAKNTDKRPADAAPNIRTEERGRLKLLLLVSDEARAHFKCPPAVDGKLLRFHPGFVLCVKHGGLIF